MSEKLVRAHRYVLHPTGEQADTFAQFAGVSRLVYNLALEQRTHFWRQYLRDNGKHINWVSQCKEVTALRAEFDFIRAVHSDVSNQAVIDLERAFRAYFSKRAGYPRYRSKASHQSFRVRGAYLVVRKLNAKWSEMRVPGVGWVKYRDTRALSGAPKAVTISRQGNQWVASISCVAQMKAAAPIAAVGIDRGVANTLALSTGDLCSLPPDLLVLDRVRRRAQRVLSRRVRGSGRYERQKAKFAAISARIARRRSDWLHRQSTAIASNFSHVALEQLKIGNMTSRATGKRGLNRSILHQGWGIFAHQLEYKVKERGGRLAYVNPAYTSQTCSACGVVDAGSRKSQAIFRCVACGHDEHADVGAAKEILRRSTARQDAEGSRWRPVEPSTMRATA